MLRILFAIFLVNIYFGFSQNKIDSLKSTLAIERDTNRIKGLSEIFWKSYLSDVNLAKECVEEELSIAKELNNEKFIAASLNDVGVYYWTQSKLDSSLIYFKQALVVFEKLKINTRVASSLNNIGNIYQDLDNYEEALAYHTKSLKIKEELDDQIKIANSHINIGNIHNQMGNLDKALEYYSNSLSIAEKNGYDGIISSALSNMSSIFFKQEEYRKSISYEQRAISIANRLGNMIEVSGSLNRMGDVYLKINKPDSAYICYKESLDIVEKMGNQDRLSELYHSLGQYHTSKKQFKEASDYLFKGLAISQEIETINQTADFYRVISLMYKEKGDYKKALENFELFRKTEDSVYDVTMDEKIQELEINYQTEKKEREIVEQQSEINELKQAAIISDLRKKLLTVLLISLLFIGGLIYYTQKQRLKRIKLEKEKESIAYENELMIKKKELTTHTLNLVQKNDLIDDLNIKLVELKKAPKIEVNDISKLIGIIKNDKIADKDWDNFKLYFDQVHENFDDKLREYFSDLTTNEIRLAALMKMKLSTKEIASVLNISPDSVKKARYRLRKKLKMDGKNRLEDFILAL